MHGPWRSDGHHWMSDFADRPWGSLWNVMGPGIAMRAPGPSGRQHAHRAITSRCGPNATLKSPHIRTFGAGDVVPIEAMPIPAMGPDATGMGPRQWLTMVEHGCLWAAGNRYDAQGSTGDQSP